MSSASPHEPASTFLLTPEPDERPIAFADRVGAWYVSRVTEEHRKGHGMYLTPATVANFMAGMLHAREKVIRLLDPSAGAGILLCAAVEQLLLPRDRPDRIELTAYEVDAGMGMHLASVLDYLATWAWGHGVEVVPHVVIGDFVLQNADLIHPSGALFQPAQKTAPFDIVIANPPYFKIAKSDPRAVAAATVVHGQPNIYGLFMAVSAAMLRQGGSMVYITPRSFASGSYFRAFREWFFERIRPVQIHVFGSRKDAFRRDEVLQENVILHGERHDGWGQERQRSVAISTSRGAADILAATSRSALLSQILDGEKDRVLRLTASDRDFGLSGKDD